MSIERVDLGLVCIGIDRRFVSDALKLCGHIRQRIARFLQSADGSNDEGSHQSQLASERGQILIECRQGKLIGGLSDESLALSSGILKNLTDHCVVANDLLWNIEQASHHRVDPIQGIAISRFKSTDERLPIWRHLGESGQA
ncbi:hypothetical protein D3C84_846260 [compost metagenome]